MGQIVSDPFYPGGQGYVKPNCSEVLGGLGTRAIVPVRMKGRNGK